MKDLNKYKVLVASALVAIGAASLALGSITTGGGLANIFGNLQLHGTAGSQQQEENPFVNDPCTELKKQLITFKRAGDANSYSVIFPSYQKLCLKANPGNQDSK